MSWKKKKSKEFRLKLAKEAKVADRVKATLEEKLAKLNAENAELQNQLQGSQENLQTIQHNYATVLYGYGFREASKTS